MLSLNGTDADGLLVDHLHHLPFATVLGWATILATAEVLHVLSLSEFLAQLRPNENFAWLTNEVLHSFDNAIADLNKFLL